MAISAAFTVDGASNPAAHEADYGATVTLALVSTADVASVAFSIVGASNSGATTPTLTPGGIPSGASSTFPMPADPGDGLGRSFRVKCRVVGVNGDCAETHGVVGALNGAAVLPAAAGETDDRGSYGWIDILNAALNSTSVNPNFQTGTSYTVTASDHGGLVSLSNASAIALTAPEDSTEDLPVNFQCGIYQAGAGQASVAVEGTDTLESENSYVKLSTKGSAGWLWKRGSGDWVLTGSLTS